MDYGLILWAAPSLEIGKEERGCAELIELTGASGGGRAVDVQVTRLRRKIEQNPKLPRYLRTVRGKGYVLRPD